MKLTNTHTMKRKSGMTLLELTVVILVLLSLIAILFVGARAWKKGSDRSANILNIRNCQQALRGHQNMRGYLANATVTEAEIFGTPAAGTTAATQGYLRKPVPPIADVTAYTFGTTYGESATIWVTNPTLGKGDGEYFFTTAELPEKTGEW